MVCLQGGLHCLPKGPSLFASRAFTVCIQGLNCLPPGPSLFAYRAFIVCLQGRHCLPTGPSLFASRNFLKVKTFTLEMDSSK